MVTKKGYDWSDLSAPPTIDAHSVAKHKVVRSYVERYVHVLTANPRIDRLRINFVDGFAGGGVYTFEGGRHLGSPLLLLDTIAGLEKTIQAQRTKAFSIDARYFFVEKNRAAVRALNYHLRDSGYDPTVMDSIVVQHAGFVDVLPPILDEIRSSGRQKRTVFLLDQYGYKDVPFESLRLIFSVLPYAEVILTFATDALINYMSEEPTFLKAIKGLDMESIFVKDSISTFKETRNGRLMVEKIFHQHIHRHSGARFFTPFFIRSPESNRSYWLVHLSMHPKARDEMARIHWELRNTFSHYGKAGLHMLGFDPAKEDFGQGAFSFYFDDDAEARTQDALTEDIPNILSLERPISFRELFAENCNDSPAYSKQFKESLFRLQRMKEIHIWTNNGGKRRAANTISPDDLIELIHTFRFLPRR